MNNGLPSQDEFFEICGETLDTALYPLHYKETTLRGLRLIGKSLAGVELKRLSEDLREKMLVRDSDGKYSRYFYVGKPYYMGAIKHWFVRELFQCEPILIPPPENDVGFLIDTIYEALMRDMIKKNPAASDEARYEAKAHGLAIEHVTSRWFQDSFPTLYLPPDNLRQYKMYCDHDFKLKLPGKILKVDVYSKWKEKKPTDIHLYCTLTEDRQAIEWRSVLTGNQYQVNTIPELGKSPLKMVVWLNCIAGGLDYEVFRRAAYGLVASIE